VALTDTMVAAVLANVTLVAAAKLWGVTGARVLRSAKVAVDGHRPSRWLRGPGA
jgi:hypothetical protein